MALEDAGPGAEVEGFFLPRTMAVGGAGKPRNRSQLLAEGHGLHMYKYLDVS
jgi:hypothetical protein